MFVDFAGKGLPFINRSTGEERKAPLFVAALEASSYTYAEAVETQSLPNWIGAHVRAFEYFCCVPEIIVPVTSKSERSACFLLN